MTLTYFAIINGLLGLAFGSFITMASYRIPNGLSLFGRSKCTHCGHTLGVKDLIPIISMFLLRGKCRYCKANVSFRYMATELLTAVVFVLNALIVGDDYTNLLIMHLASILLITLLVVDLETFYIPDNILLALVAIGVIYAFINDFGIPNMVFMPILNAFIAWFISWTMKFFMKKESMGTGDIKLFLVAGFFLTPDNLSMFYFMTGFFGVMIGIYWKENRIGIYFPFGPAICASLYLCMLFGNRLDINTLLS